MLNFNILFIELIGILSISDEKNPKKWFWLLKVFKNKWAVTPQSEKLISFNSVSRGCVNVTILIYFTLSFPLENSHPTFGQKIEIFNTFYLVSKSLIFSIS